MKKTTDYKIIYLGMKNHFILDWGEYSADLVDSIDYATAQIYFGRLSTLLSYATYFGFDYRVLMTALFNMNRKTNAKIFDLNTSGCNNQ